MTPPPPAPQLGPIWDGVLTGLSWITLMGLLGVLVLLLLAAPVAVDLAARARVTSRLSRVAVVLGVLALPAGLADLAHGASETGGYDVGAAWSQLYGGGFAGVLIGLQYTLTAAAAALMIAVVLRPGAPWARTVTAVATAAAAVALITTKFPDEVPDDWGRELFSTLMWVLHLVGGGVWVGGLVGLLALALPGAVPAAARGAFWSRTIRRFSATAMGCVAAITLSGLWLYWEHVDGPSQLFTTLYGRVLGVKILIFGTMTLLGAANQFWLHPRIDRLRAAGDTRPLLVLLAREFPVVVGVEVALGVAVLMVAPFLHGSARNEVFQRENPEAAAAHQKAPAKLVSGSTWVFGAGETILVGGVMAGGYAWSGRLARRRTAAA